MDLIKCQDPNEKFPVDARELHRELESKQDFSTWIKGKIKTGGFVENEDFRVFHKSVENPLGGRPSIDYSLTINMSKHLCQLEGTSKGKQCREYFIRTEEKYQRLQVEQPDLFQIPKDFAEALELAAQQWRDNKKLEARNAYLLPKAEYAETIMDSDSLLNMTAVAKPLGIGAPTLNKFLYAQGIVRKNGKSWVPTFKYQDREDLFKIVTTEKNVCVGTDDEHLRTFQQLKATEKGARFIRELWREKNGEAA